MKQQQTAARLVKAAQAGGFATQEGGPTAAQSASKFTWWAVCSLVLQARAALLGEYSGGLEGVEGCHAAAAAVKAACRCGL